MKILMVCLGNICRSPLAEGILRSLVNQLELTWQVDSAGTEGYHIGEPPHFLSQKVARKRGLDISYQRARRFTREDFDHYDLIYAMAGDVFQEIGKIGGRQAKMNKVLLLMDELFPGTHQSVPDPYGGGEEDFDGVFDLLERCCKKITGHYAPQLNTIPQNYENVFSADKSHKIKHHQH